MGVAKQLYQLQELDLEIESNEQALSQKSSQLGDRQVLDRAQAGLAAEQQRLDNLRHQQNSSEWEIDDLTDKIKTAEEHLYDGRTSNPKELSSLQHEVNILKAKRDQLETQALEIMEQADLAATGVAATSNELKQLEDDWHHQQQQLSAEIEHLSSKLSELKDRRQSMLAGLDPQAVAAYEKIRKQKGQAVAKVEQGICRACRISLAFSALQQVKSDNLVQCSSCGRILFLP
jgi:uncharacterized protein